MTTSTNPTALGKALSEQAIRNVNFFNGRLVTSRDMARTQQARQEADARLGQGIGAGIVHGLEIGIGNASQRQLTITPGLAISAAGQTLCLGASQVVALAPMADATAPVMSMGGFGHCGVLSGGGYVVGNGLYLLSLAPVMVDEGKAPVLALEPGNARCNTDAVVEAVQFRLLRVNDTLLAGIGLDANPVGPAAISKWRSAVAYACFGYPGLPGAHALFGAAPATGSLLQAMRLGALSDCDVPLALVYMTDSQGIVFIDAWAVRRRVAGEPASQAWSAWFGPGLDALGEAQLAQFQQQLAEIPGASLPGLKAADWFSWLPPAGFLDASGARRLDGKVFLDARKPARTVPLAQGDVRALLAQALRRDAVKLEPGNTPPRFRLYVVDGGMQFFVREAPNAPHAEEVWVDGERARLPGVHDVQSAIDALRARGCNTISLWPGDDLQARIDALVPGSHVNLCFEAGQYALKKPLRLQGLGIVHVEGSGWGTVLRCEEAETALLVSECEYVAISRMAFSGGTPSIGKSDIGSGLMGALTVFNCRKVVIDQVAASCTRADSLSTAAIVVRQRAAEVSITGCEVIVGGAQLGILVVDCTRSCIAHNHVGILGSTFSMERGIVVAGIRAETVTIVDNRVVDAAQGIAIGLSRSETSRGEPLSVGRAVVSRNTVGVFLTERDLKRNRFGIFVGNANSLLLEGNRITGTSEAERAPLEAIRLSGVYGKHLVVSTNHLSGASTGIAFTPQAPLPARDGPANSFDKQRHRSCVWLFDANLAEQAEVALACTSSVAELLIERDNYWI